MSHAPSVSVVVLNWNGLDLTSRCCTLLDCQRGCAFRLWVVDNASETDTESDLRMACLRATVLRLPENRGFAAGVNAGIRAAREAGGFDYVWLVNNDIEPDPDLLSRMVSALNDDSTLAAVGADLLEPDRHGRERSAAAGKRIRPPFYIPLPVKRGQSLDYLSGACLLIRGTTLDAVGLLDEGFFFFFEDADWSRRARRAGWRLGVAPPPPVRHAGSATIGPNVRLKAAHYRAGHIRFLRKYARYPFAAAATAAGVCLLIAILTGRWAVVAGTLDGWRRGWRTGVDSVG